MIAYQQDLTQLNTLRLPCQAYALARFSSRSELLDYLDAARQNAWSVRVLGGGSNVLFTQPIDGLVLQSAMTSICLLHEDSDYRWVAVDAGVNWHEWVKRSVAYGHGLENLALIPGSVGAAPVQNIGAYGVEVAQCIDQVEGVQLSTGQWRVLSAPECRFGYRDSVFKHELQQDFIITRVVFRLARVFAPQLQYGPLQQWAQQSASVTPDALMAEICRIRQSKLPDPSVIPNAGSFFKNPLVSQATAKALLQRFPDVVHYPQGTQGVKLAAGWLIERSGWKGRWLGNAGMHKDQALVLVTNGRATYDDVLALQQEVIASVKEGFGVELEPEPQPF